MSLWPGLHAAESALLARRRDQRGSPSFGDEADRALLDALAAIPRDGADAAHASGRRLGEGVYARRFVEDTLPHAVTVLSQSLSASGFGTLRLDHSFHRSARLTFHPADADHPETLRAFVAGVLEGFFSSAFNCDARASAAPEAILLELGDGRNVNRKGAAA